MSILSAGISGCLNVMDDSAINGEFHNAKHPKLIKKRLTCHGLKIMVTFSYAALGPMNSCTSMGLELPSKSSIENTDDLGLKVQAEIGHKSCLESSNGSLRWMTISHATHLAEILSGNKDHFHALNHNRPFILLKPLSSSGHTDSLIPASEGWQTSPLSGNTTDNHYNRSTINGTGSGFQHYLFSCMTCLQTVRTFPLQLYILSLFSHVFTSWYANIPAGEI